MTSRRDSGNTSDELLKAFTADASNYLALGCIVRKDVSPQTDRDSVPGQWTRVIKLPTSTDLANNDNVQRLIDAGWIFVQSTRSILDPTWRVFRIHALPGDLGHSVIDRHNTRLDAALHKILAEVDTSPAAWHAQFDSDSHPVTFDLWATGDDSSLFYLFNKIPSPSPDPSRVSNKYAREAVLDLQHPTSTLGLKTTLYPYQRRSAGTMLEREVAPKLVLDPRLEARVGPDGTTFFYSPRSSPVRILRQPVFYKACSGGILAESMGLGKTVVLLALILATKYHPPEIPQQFRQPVVRQSVGSLSAMLIASINRESFPWEVEFDRISHATGYDLSSCRKKLEEMPGSYDVPQLPQRMNRKTIQPPPKKMLVAATTLIVVPRNLFKQWLNEIDKHVEKDALNVLVMDHSSRALPSAEKLCQYDVILFSRNRFDLEERDGSDEQGRRLGATQLACHCPYIGATRTRDCICLRGDELYQSPLRNVHFKRLIVDEGHFASYKDSRAVQVADKLITVDHRWIVSGTPAKDLFGVEVDMSSSVSSDNTWQAPETNEARAAVLEQRRFFSASEDSTGAIKSLGSLVTHFLKITPWAPTEAEKKADWDDFVYRHEHLTKRTHTSFSLSLKRTLDAIVVKTQVADVERDIELPPLHSKVVRLEPSFYDKLTANMFTLVLTANAVTSERTDTDYLFHKNSAKARNQLIANLRQSAAIWTGFGEAEVLASIKNSTGYLAKEQTSCTLQDRDTLTNMLTYADLCLASPGWRALSRAHELGIFVDAWPSNTAAHWSFDGCETPLLTGISQLLDAQRHINERADSDDPSEGLAGAGIRALAPARHSSAIEDEGIEKSVLTKGIPSSSLDGEPALKRRGLQARQSPVKSTKNAPKPQNDDKTKTTGSRKRRRSELEAANLHSDSPYLQSKVIGSSSAKISYLMSQIIKYSATEKILVFFDGTNVAYYLAQFLELLNIRHEIYVGSLQAKTKSEYVVQFNEEPYIRVLLMDVKQAAYGLNMSAASRIFFVNPVCRPNVEAQAIKRAHRIGQTRPVYVETLVLKGSIEEKILERSQRMTRTEHQDAKVLEDDGGIQEIIQGAQAISIHEHEKSGYGQMARIDTPQQLFSRQNWQNVLAWGPNKSPRKPAAKRRKKDDSTKSSTSATNGQGNSDSLFSADMGGGSPTPTASSSRRSFFSHVEITGSVESDTSRGSAVNEDDDDADDVPLSVRLHQAAAAGPSTMAKAGASSAAATNDVPGDIFSSTSMNGSGASSSQGKGKAVRIVG